MEKKVVTIIVVALLIGGIIGYYVAKPYDEIARLETEISTLHSDYAGLNTVYNELLVEYTELNATYNELLVNYADPDALYNELIADYANLNTLYNALITDYAELDVLYNEQVIDYNNLDLLLDTEILGVYFSPDGGAAGQVIDWIDRANETIHVLIYSFTNDDIGDAVMRARQRGVEIKVVFEKSQISQYSEYMKLRTVGVLVRNDTNSGLMHHKVAVIDGYLLLTGSFNWSASAEERNNENLMVIISENLATTFEEEFQKIWNSSV